MKFIRLLLRAFMNNVIVKIMKYFYIITLLAAALVGCEEETSEAIVLTEDVLYVTGERVRISGRIYENGGMEVSDHGFEIALDDQFTEVIANISLGPTNKLGQFLGYNDALDMGSAYYYRAYMLTSEGQLVGETKEFSTLETRLTTFFPLIAYPGDKLEIIGTNFTKNTKVFFNDVAAEIVNIELESIIEVIIPPLKEFSEVVLSVEIEEEKISFEEKFEYIFGQWNKDSDFIDNYGFVESLALQTDDKFVFGLGINQDDLLLNPNIWEFDLNTEIWTPLSFFGAGVRSPFYNNEGYFGGGVITWSDSFDRTAVISREFWRYDNGNLIYLGLLPFQLYASVSFSHSGDIYVTGGSGPSSSNHILYKYNIASETWSVEGEIPFVTNSNLGNFEYNNNQYLFSDDGVLWSLNYDSLTWSQVDFFPGNMRYGGISAIVGDKAYVGLFAGDDRMWEYNIPTGEWKQKVRIEDNKTNKNSGVFVKDSKLYVVRANPFGSEENKMTLWEFDPNKF